MLKPPRKDGRRSRRHRGESQSPSPQPYAAEAQWTASPPSAAIVNDVPWGHMPSAAMSGWELDSSTSAWDAAAMAPPQAPPVSWRESPVPNAATCNGGGAQCPTAQVPPAARRERSPYAAPLDEPGLQRPAAEAQLANPGPPPQPETEHTTSTDEVDQEHIEAYSLHIANLLSRGHEVVRAAILNFMAEQTRAAPMQAPVVSSFPTFECARGSEIDRIDVQIMIQHYSSYFQVAYRSRCSIITRSTGYAESLPQVQPSIDTRQHRSSTSRNEVLQVFSAVGLEWAVPSHQDEAPSLWQSLSRHTAATICDMPEGLSAPKEPSMPSRETGSVGIGPHDLKSDGLTNGFHDLTAQNGATTEDWQAPETNTSVHRQGLNSSHNILPPYPVGDSNAQPFQPAAPAAYLTDSNIATNPSGRSTDDWGSTSAALSSGAPASSQVAWPSPGVTEVSGACSKIIPASFPAAWSSPGSPGASEVHGGNLSTAVQAAPRFAWSSPSVHEAPRDRFPDGTPAEPPFSEPSPDAGGVQGSAFSFAPRSPRAGEQSGRDFSIGAPAASSFSWSSQGAPQIQQDHFFNEVAPASTLVRPASGAVDMQAWDFSSGAPAASSFGWPSPGDAEISGGNFEDPWVTGPSEPAREKKKKKSKASAMKALGPVQDGASSPRVDVRQNATFASGQPGEREAKIRQLMSMGFDRNQSTEALNMHDGDVQRAIPTLLKDPQSVSLAAATERRTRDEPQHHSVEEDFEAKLAAAAARSGVQLGPQGSNAARRPTRRGR